MYDKVKHWRLDPKDVLKYKYNSEDGKYYRKIVFGYAQTVQKYHRVTLNNINNGFFDMTNAEQLTFDDSDEETDTEEEEQEQVKEEEEQVKEEELSEEQEVIGSDISICSVSSDEEFVSVPVK